MLHSSETRSLFQTSAASCGLDVSHAYLEPELLVPFFPNDFICGSHIPESSCKMILQLTRATRPDLKAHNCSETKHESKGIAADVYLWIKSQLD